MSYRIFETKQFLKAVRRRAKGGRSDVVKAAEEVVQLLEAYDDRAFFVLRTRWRDHPLKGDKRGIRELHLSVDDLLLYRIHEEMKAIHLLDIVSHEELRKQ